MAENRSDKLFTCISSGLTSSSLTKRKLKVTYDKLQNQNNVPSNQDRKLSYCSSSGENNRKANLPYIMQTPVSCRKRKRLTLNNHTVKTVMIIKNIMAKRNTVSIVWYLFSFSAAAFSLALSSFIFLVSAIVKINTRNRQNFTKTDVLYAAILVRRQVTGLDPAHHGQYKEAWYHYPSQ